MLTHFQQEIYDIIIYMRDICEDKKERKIFTKILLKLPRMTEKEIKEWKELNQIDKTFMVCEKCKESFPFLEKVLVNRLPIIQVSKKKDKTINISGPTGPQGNIDIIGASGPKGVPENVFYV